jgi:hypothetical protein
MTVSSGPTWYRGNVRTTQPCKSSITARHGRESATREPSQRIATTALQSTRSYFVGEGCIGLTEDLAVASTPHQATVCLAGAALRLDKHTLRGAMERDEVLRNTLLGHASRWSADLAQAIVCHRFHSVLQRLCRWLLTAADRTDLVELEITHETLAHVLGVARPVLSRAALELHDAAAIRTRRGRVVLLDRPMLERSACECYDLTRHPATARAVGSQVDVGRVAKGTFW